MLAQITSVNTPRDLWNNYAAVFILVINQQSVPPKPACLDEFIKTPIQKQHFDHVDGIYVTKANTFVNA